MDNEERIIRDTLGLKNTGKGHSNYSVQAGAGAGKTTMFSTRICQQILDGIPIDEFVIVTYTNAAASELREKITTALTTALASGGLSEEAGKNASEALNSIELMQISTIHSFLFKILRENAFETGVVLDCQMLEAEDDNVRKRKFFEDWYHENSGRVYAELGAWEIHSKNGNKNDCQKQILENLFMDIANVREEIIYLKDVDYKAEIDKIVTKYIQLWLPHIVAFKNAYDNNRPKDDKTGELMSHSSGGIGKIYDDMSYIVSTTNSGLNEAIKISMILDVIYSISLGKCNFYNAQKKAGKEANTVIIPQLSFFMNPAEYDILTDIDYYRVSWATKYAVEIQKLYQEAIDKETRVLSNDDILYRAERLLTNNMEVLDKLRDKYSKIYVDEFQDTTYLQTRLIELLAGKKGTGLNPVELEDDKLIVVGDPKQSIYRFTGAEKGIYDEVNTLMSALPNADALTLPTNFRSNRDIIDWVNDKYSKLMGSDYSPMDTDWVVNEKNALHGVYRYEASGAYKTETDINAVVGIVQELVNNDKHFVEEIERDSQGAITGRYLRPIKYSDIMIITKVTTKILGFVEAFGEAGIPVNVNGKFKVTDDQILNNFYKLVKCLANIKSKLNKAEMTELLKGVDVACLSADSFRKYSKEIYDISRFFSDNNMDPASQVQYLLNKEEYYLPHNAELTINTVRSYKIRLHQMVETCLTNSPNNMISIAEAMAGYLGADVKRENPLESNENAVRLMNVHQAKGLTGQIVIIADRRSDEEVRYGAFRKSGKYYPAASYSSGDKSAKSLISSYTKDSAIMAIAEKEEIEESIRLQYVAATRAAHALIFMAPINDNVWFSAPEYDYDSIPSINSWIEARKEDDSTYQLVSGNSNASHSVLRLDDLNNSISSADMSVLGVARIASITPSSLEKPIQSGFTSGQDGYVSEARPKGNVFGDVLHRTNEMIISRWDVIGSLTGDELDKALTRIINQAILEKEELRKNSDSENGVEIMETDEEFLDFDHRAKYMKYLKEVLLVNDYIGRVLKPIIDSADELYPEYEFGFYVTDSERAEFLNEFKDYFEERKIVIPNDCAIYVNGKADLVVRKQDGSIAIYDYKSDTMNGKGLVDFEATAAGKYEGQMKLYRYAMSKAFECDINSIAAPQILHLYL